MKIAFYTFGCKVNQYETQALRQQFAAAGWEVLDFAHDAPWDAVRGREPLTTEIERPVNRA